MSESDHSHAETHSHGQSHGHSHGQGADFDTNGRMMAFAAVLIGGFMIAEVVGGLISGSLALLADAGHMFSDFASLCLAWYAFHISKRPPTKKMSYGVDRFQVLAAFLNGVTLVFLCIWISIEAIQRMIEPVEVLSGTMMVIATLGLIVNIAAYFILNAADKDNLNVRGAKIHVIGDMLGSVAAIAAAGIIMATGWNIADPILSLLVVAIVLRSAYYVIRESGHILLEGTPAFLDSKEINDDLTANIDDLMDVHHFHAWSITQARSVATLHARMATDATPDLVIRAVKERLKLRFGIHHSTIEVEFQDCADTFVAPNPRSGRH